MTSDINNIMVTEGGIYKVPFPFSDLSETKYRLALASDNLNQHGDIRFMFITTTAVDNKQHMKHL